MYKTDEYVVVSKSDLDVIISSLSKQKVDWRTVLQVHFGFIDKEKDSHRINSQAYSLVEHTSYELSGGHVQDVFYDGVGRWTGMQDYQGEHLAEIAGISQRLKNSNVISVEEKEEITRFLDPEFSDLSDMPHSWFWLTMGSIQPNESPYFNSEEGIFEVPPTTLRNILMFEMGAFFQIEDYTGKETEIQTRLEATYPIAERRDDFDFWKEYIFDPDNSLSGRLLRKHPVHQWLWQNYHNVLINRLLNPNLDFTEYTKPREEKRPSQ